MLKVVRNLLLVAAVLLSSSFVRWMEGAKFSLCSIFRPHPISRMKLVLGVPWYLTLLTNRLSGFLVRSSSISIRGWYLKILSWGNRGEKWKIYPCLSVKFIKASRKETKVFNQYFFSTSFFLPFCFPSSGAATVLEIWGRSRTLAVRSWPFVPPLRSFGTLASTSLTWNRKELTEQGLPRWVAPA